MHTSLKYLNTHSIKASDIKKVYGSGNLAQDAKLKKMLNILDKMGVDVQKSNLPRYEWMATVEGSK